MSVSNQANDNRLFQVILPKQTRLRDAFAPILQNAGFAFDKEKSRHAYGACRDLRGNGADFDASLRKPEDALRKLSDNKADMAILGADKFIEARAKAEIEGNGASFKLDAVMDFNCAACSMYIAAAQVSAITCAADLENKRIATSFPYSLQAWLAEQGVSNVEIIKCDGDTEDEIRDGSADAIFEIVDSGQSLIDNGLEKKIWAYDITAVLVARRDLNLSPNAEAAKTFMNRLQTPKVSVVPECTPLRIGVAEPCYA